jgi:hypothetical protein
MWFFLGFALNSAIAAVWLLPLQSRKMKALISLSLASFAFLFVLLLPYDGVSGPKGQLTAGAVSAAPLGIAVGAIVRRKWRTS